MVWERMGLFDEAIREHLELKRRGGVGSEEVGHQEREVLGPPPSSSPDLPDFGLRGQETAELDMSTVLAEEPPSSRASSLGEAPEASAEGGEVGTEDAPETSSGDSLEWEILEDHGSAGQEHPGEDHPQGAVPDGHGDAPEDVLAETPDFLRETPEQERLWFEQRPPRDFDFKK
jgi:hypothetical protein